jgi:hypothetical protein
VISIRPLSDCPNKDIVGEHKRALGSAPSTIVVGGPPALISSAFEPGITYINDSRQAPIAWGSAFHLEWDAPSEGPTSFLPTTFMEQQLQRLVVPETLAQVEASGQFSWRTLDWVGWIRQPHKWLEGLRLAWHFQQAAASQSDPFVRAAVMAECAARSQRNQDFFERLDADMQGTLLLPRAQGQGSVIIARTPAEVADLDGLRAALEVEGRSLVPLSPQVCVGPLAGMFV